MIGSKVVYKSRGSSNKGLYEIESRYKDSHDEDILVIKNVGTGATEEYDAHSFKTLFYQFTFDC